MDQVAGYRLFRGVTAAMAITLGALSIGNLWVVTLSPDSLFDAARGVVLLLIALGLMGEHRLSLALSAIVCLPAANQLWTQQLSGFLSQLELALFIASVGLLLWATYLKRQP